MYAIANNSMRTIHNVYYVSNNILNIIKIMTDYLFVVNNAATVVRLSTERTALNFT